MRQKSDYVMRPSFSCDTLNLPVGTAVRIDDDLEIAPINRVADPNYIGRIIANYYDSTVYTVTTKYNQRYDKAVAGVDSLVVGPGLHGPDGKIYPFTAAAPGYHAGTVAGPFTFTSSTNILSVQVNSVTAQTFTLTNATAQAVCDFVNATAVDFVMSVLPSGMVAISAVNTDDTITIGAPSNHCNAVLGLTAAAYAPTAGSHGSPSCMIIKGGDAGDLIEILED